MQALSVRCCSLSSLAPCGCADTSSTWSCVSGAVTSGAPAFRVGALTGFWGSLVAESFEPSSGDGASFADAKFTVRANAAAKPQADFVKNFNSYAPDAQPWIVVKDAPSTATAQQRSNPATLPYRVAAGPTPGATIDEHQSQAILIAEMRRLGGLGATGAAILGWWACTPFEPSAEVTSRGKANLDVGGDVEVFSWWTSGGELEAFQAMLDVHEERVPDARVTNAAVEFADKAREQLGIRLSAGNPPDLFQANSGTDLLDWVNRNGIDSSSSVVEDLSDLADALEWYDAFDPDVLETLTQDGLLYGVPFNVHRINTLYYRKDLFEQFDLRAPETLDELVSLCERIASDDEIQTSAPEGKMACLALGNKWDWTLSLMTFEMIFPAIAGPDFYEDYFLGRETALPSQMVAALDMTLHLYCGGAESDCLDHTWFNSDINERTWDEGVRKLSDGKAMMAPMGDWAKGFLESPAGGNLKAGTEFDAIPFPGTAGTFVFTADSFTMPKGINNRDGARSLLRTIGSKEAQIAFNRLKGSIPARMDIDPGNFDETQQMTMEAFETARKVRALSGLVPTNSRDRLHPELSDSIRNESTEIISRFLRTSYPLD